VSDQDIRAREDAHEAERHALMAAIAAALPGSWTVVPCKRGTSEASTFYACTSFDIARADGVTLALYWEEREKRVRVSGDWPRVRNSATWYRDVNVDRITCSVTRGGEAIARDIARRYLPAFLPALAKMQAKKEEEENTRAKAEALVYALAKVMGKTVTKRNAHGDVFDDRAAALYDYDHGFDVQVQPYGSVRFDVNTNDPVRALKIAQFLMSLEREER
jgi:phage protein D